MPEKLPKKEFCEPVLPLPELRPKKALSDPAALLKPDPEPKKELLPPVVMALPEPLPKNELKFPVGFCLPASTPKRVFVKDSPLTVSTRFKPTLYCVPAVKVLAEPSPLS